MVILLKSHMGLVVQKWTLLGFIYGTFAKDHLVFCGGREGEGIKFCLKRVQPNGPNNKYIGHSWQFCAFGSFGILGQK